MAEVASRLFGLARIVAKLKRGLWVGLHAFSRDATRLNGSSCRLVDGNGYGHDPGLYDLKSIIDSLSHRNKMSHNTFVFRSELSHSPEPSISNSSPQDSPNRPRAYGRNGQKERKPPSITPRKFTRFFTPRSHGPDRLSASRQALFDITVPANNRNGIQSSPLRPFRDIPGQENSTSISFTRELKRRKIIHTPESSPDDASPSKGFQTNQNFVLEDDSERDDDIQVDLPTLPKAVRSSLSQRLEMLSRNTPPKRITQLDDQGLNGRLLQLSIDSSSGSTRQTSRYPVPDWQYETADFYSRPEDVHISTSIGGPERCIPFCAVGCNSTSHKNSDQLQLTYCSKLSDCCWR